MKVSPFLFAALLGIDASPSVVEVKLPRSNGFALSYPSPSQQQPITVKRSKRSTAAEKRRARKRGARKRCMKARRA